MGQHGFQFFYRDGLMLLQDGEQRLIGHGISSNDEFRQCVRIFRREVGQQ